MTTSIVVPNYQGLFYRLWCLKTFPFIFLGEGEIHFWPKTRYVCPHSTKEISFWFRDSLNLAPIRFNLQFQSTRLAHFRAHSVGYIASLFPPVFVVFLIFYDCLLSYVESCCPSWKGRVQQQKLLVCFFCSTQKLLFKQYKCFFNKHNNSTNVCYIYAWPVFCQSGPFKLGHLLNPAQVVSVEEKYNEGSFQLVFIGPSGKIKLKT